MARFLMSLAIVVLTVIGAIMTALLCVQFSAALPGDQTVAGWAVLDTVGTKRASALQRLLWAQSAFAVMPSPRALYFVRTTTDDGRDLEGGCRYQIVGTPPDAKWWSVTVYNEGISAIPSDGPGTVNPDTVQLDPGGSFTIYVSGVSEPGNWLSNRTSGTLVIVYRIYEPSASLLGDLSSAKLPTVLQSGGCA